MGDTQVNERVKEAPAHALRAMFAGIGRLLSVTDKIRNKPAPAAAPADAGTVAPETAVPAGMAPETVTPETAAPETAVPEAAVPEAEPSAPAAPGGPHVRLLPADAVSASEDAAAATPAAEPAAAEPAAAAATPAAEPAAPEAAPAVELPVPNYDDLSIASLRARLRNLSADQLSQLIEYEKGHAGRADVIAMFERRITKLAEG